MKGGRCVCKGKYGRNVARIGEVSEEKGGRSRDNYWRGF